jgi:hypothetical protein
MSVHVVRVVRVVHVVRTCIAWDYRSKSKQEIETTVHLFIFSHLSSFRTIATNDY